MRRNFGTGWRTAFKVEKESEDLVLDLLDAALCHVCSAYRNDATELDEILKEGGSAWCVNWEVLADAEDATQPVIRPVRRVGIEVPGRHPQPLGLRRRMSPDNEAAMREVLSNASASAQSWLASALTEVFGRNPDPSKAYSDSVKAVEATLQPLVLPDDKIATLGKMIAAINDKPGKWQVALGVDGEADVLRLAGVLEVLWKGQTDRHGHPSPRSITQTQAETAFRTAVYCVGLGAGGGFIRV